MCKALFTVIFNDQFALCQCYTFCCSCKSKKVVPKDANESIELLPTNTSCAARLSVISQKMPGQAVTDH